MNLSLSLPPSPSSSSPPPPPSPRPVHTDEEVGEELIQEESSELKLDEELIEEGSGDSEEEGPMFLDLGTLQPTKTNDVSHVVVHGMV